MLNWHNDYNWTKEQVIECINTALKEGKDKISLDAEHNDWQNEQDMIKWANELGYSAYLERESIKITLKQSE